MPSVRGPKRILVASLLTISSAGSGALTGFVLGVIGEAFGVADVPRWAVVVAAALVVVVDAFVPPLSVRRQVPQLWGRVFDVRTTAVLYGLRLGVGPLTILRTWWWWFAVVTAALAGVWWSVAVGASFGVARILVMLGAGTRAGCMRRSERLAIASGAGVLAVIVVAALALPEELAGDDRSSASRSRAPAPSAAPTNDGSAAPSTSSVPAPRAIPADPGLVLALPADIGERYELIPDDPGRALGALDLATAAAIEQDEPAERSLLETRRFQIGHARAWRHRDGRVAYVAAYRFGSADDAAAYLVDGFITLESRGARVYGLASPAGARGFSQAASAGETSEVAHGVGFTRGDVLVLVVETSRGSAATPSGAQRIAQLVEMSVAEPRSAW
ncbi:MAG TPA: hypothetical protein VM345_13820 [Acidimicrobiales bacterium]|nr:hypothetical protein [Acidimicrobiales bacterium]